MQTNDQWCIKLDIDGCNALLSAFTNVRNKLRTVTLPTRNVKAPITWRWKKWRWKTTSLRGRPETYGRDCESLKQFVRRAIREGHPAAEECREWARRKGMTV